MLEAHDTATTYCHYHPDTPTSLRCNRCNKPICPKDAVRTPTGYRCKDCIRQQQSVYFSAVPTDYLIAALIALPIGYLAQRFVPRIGFFVLLIGPAIGGIIGEVIWRATGRRRGRYTWLAALASLSAGAFVAFLPTLVFMLAGFGFNLGAVWDVVFFAFMAGAVLARLRYWR